MKYMGAAPSFFVATFFRGSCLYLEHSRNSDKCPLWAFGGDKSWACRKIHFALYSVHTSVSYSIPRINRLSSLPRGFGAFPMLEVLDLTYNNLNEQSLSNNFFIMGKETLQVSPGNCSSLCTSTLILDIAGAVQTRNWSNPTPADRCLSHINNRHAAGLGVVKNR